MSTDTQAELLDFKIPNAFGDLAGDLHGRTLRHISEIYQGASGSRAIAMEHMLRDLVSKRLLTEHEEQQLAGVVRLVMSKRLKLISGMRFDGSRRHS